MGVGRLSIGRIGLLEQPICRVFRPHQSSDTNSWLQAGARLCAGVAHSRDSGTVLTQIPVLTFNTDLRDREDRMGHDHSFRNTSVLFCHRNTPKRITGSSVDLTCDTPLRPVSSLVSTRYCEDRFAYTLVLVLVLITSTGSRLCSCGPRHQLTPGSLVTVTCDSDRSYRCTTRCSCGD